MQPPRWVLFAVLLFALTLARGAIVRLPVGDFARDPEMSRARLSPDGAKLAFLRNYAGHLALHVSEINPGKQFRLDLGPARLANNAEKSVWSFQWVGNDRLVITTAVWDQIYGVVASNWNGSRSVPLSGFEDPNYRVMDTTGPVTTVRAATILSEVVFVNHDADDSILMLDRHQLGAGNTNRPDLVRVNTLTGAAETVLKNPGEVAAYGLDLTGVARLGVLSHGALSGAIYRENATAPWRTILPLKERTGQMRPIGFDGATDQVLVSNLNAERRWAVYLLNPSDGSLGAPRLSDPVYDILPEGFVPAADGQPLAGPIFSKAKHALIGIRYYTEAPRVKWFDQDFVRYQAAVDKALPATVNLLVDQSLDGRKLLWFAYSDQDPGSYHLLDLDARVFKRVGTCQPGLKPAQLAPTLAISYQARDGLGLHGYLTVPVGHGPKGLPLVVMPHGGPWVRDVWGYDPLVQLLANRGYAVLQMNYRGSTGYGDDLYQQARRQIGGAIQDDIEDATRWAIDAGVADPHRIAIMGSSYGGYSALFALGRSPGLYRCGISMAGVTDWPAMFEESDVAERKLARQYWQEQIGDPDQGNLRAISPVAFADKITAPVLIIQGKADRRVPQDQARRMIDALERAGRKPDRLFLSDVGHGFGREKDRNEIFTTVVAFLAKHLGPGVE